MPRSSTRAELLLAAFALGASVTGAVAQEREPDPLQEQAARLQDAEPLWRFAQEEVSLADLLDFSALSRGIAIEFDREKLQGERVRVQPFLGLSAEELWRIANRALAVRSLALIQAPAADSLSVVPIAQAASLARLEPDGIQGASAGYVRVLVPLRNRKAEGLAETMRLVLSKEGASVAELREPSAVLVSDLTWHVEQALQLLAVLDARGEAPAVLELPLLRASPLGLVALLERVLAARKQVAPDSELQGRLQAVPEADTVLVVAPAAELEEWRALVERFDREEPVVTEHYEPRRFGLAETAALIESVVHTPDSTEAAGSWRLVVDGLTGALIVTTSPSRHQEIQRLMARLESTTPGARRPMRSYPIRHRQVGEVVEVLRQLLEAGAIEQPEAVAAAEPSVEGATASIQRPARSVSARGKGGDEEIVLTADEPTNRIIAVGEAALLDQLGPLIETIDVRHAQVLVEALVVSVNESLARDLGIELQKRGTSDGVIYQLSSLFGLGSPAPTLLDLPTAQGSGFTGVVLDPGDFSAVVRALEALNQGRSLTIPKVLVNNNQEAQLDSVLESPYLSTNASQTVATTSFGGSLEAGTTISVKPQVAEGDQVVLDYSVSLSAFVGEPAAPELPPPRQQNQLTSIVTVPDGFTVVVGGLEMEMESEGTSQVPLLGSIPGLGALFRSTSTTRSKARFFVFLRCSVLRSATFEDLKYLSAGELAEAELDDGWPRIEPRVIR